LEKVILLLEALEFQKKNIAYYALDLSAEELASTIQAIPTQKFEHVHFSALHGTFEDGLLWLKETPGVCDLPHCILLFGLTIGNFSRENAALFLRNITAYDRTRIKEGSEENQPRTSIILTMDSCKAPTKISRAYTSEGVVPFALTALKYGNTLLEKGRQVKGEKMSNVFNTDEWYFLSHWNYILGRHEASLIPRSKDIQLGAPLDRIVVRKEENIRFGCSYKYDQAEREALFAAARLENVAVWMDDSCDVAFYKLQVCTEGIIE
jgi:4-dimethylallyltryptophan N-methyltransferase